MSDVKINKLLIHHILHGNKIFAGYCQWRVEAEQFHSDYLLFHFIGLFNGDVNEILFLLTTYEIKFIELLLAATEVLDTVFSIGLHNFRTILKSPPPFCVYYLSESFEVCLVTYLFYTLVNFVVVLHRFFYIWCILKFVEYIFTPVD